MFGQKELIRKSDGTNTEIIISMNNFTENIFVLVMKLKILLFLNESNVFLGMIEIVLKKAVKIIFKDMQRGFFKELVVTVNLQTTIIPLFKMFPIGFLSLMNVTSISYCISC